MPEPIAIRQDGNDPEHDTLAPAEGVAFVLHDMFAMAFDETAPGPDPVPGADRTRQREIVDTFRADARGGDIDALLAVLDPDVVVRADGAVVQAGASQEVRGAGRRPAPSRGSARAAQRAIVWSPWADVGTGRSAACRLRVTIARGRRNRLDRRRREDWVA